MGDHVNMDSIRWMTHCKRKILLVWVIAMAGCAVSPQMAQQVDVTVQQALTHRVQQPAPISEPPESGPGVLRSFSDLFMQAVANSPALAIADLYGELGGLAVEQAQSHKWPRADIELTAEVPVREDGVEYDDVFSGGLFIRYDLNRVLFFKDYLTLSRLKQQRVWQEKKIARRKLLFDLYDLVNEWIYTRQLLPDYDLILAAIGDGLAQLSRESGQPGSLDRQRKMQQMKDQQRNYDLKRSEGRWRLRLLQSELFQIVGAIDHMDVAVSDFDTLIAAPDAGCLAGPDDNLALPDIQSIWHKRPEARMAEAALYLAEMNIINAKRRRLPQFSAGLGIGWTDLNNEVNEAGVTPYIRLSMPLLDMGDIRRQVRMTEKKRDIEKERITAMARRMVQAVRQTGVAARLACMRYQGLHQQLNREIVNTETIKRLCAIGRAKPIRQHAALHKMIETRIQRHESLFAYRRNQMEYFKNTGTVPEALRHLVDRHGELKSTDGQVRP